MTENGVLVTNFSITISNFNLINNHIYLFGFYIQDNTVYTTGDSLNTYTSMQTGSTTYPRTYAERPFRVVEVTQDLSTSMAFKTAINGITNLNLKIYPLLYDLTVMFGQSMATYIHGVEYGNEIENSLNITYKGVELFKSIFPKDYYSYTPTPYFLNVRTSGKRVVGFNAYNNETGKAQLLGSNKYQVSGTYTSLSYVDISGNEETLTIDSDNTFIPIADGTLTITGGDNTTCVNLYWDGEREGDFEPYEEYTYSVDDSIKLKGTISLDSNNNLVYDGDVYKSDGNVIENYAEIYLGELTWEVGDGSIPELSQLTNYF